MKEEKSIVKVEIPVERITQLIFVIRGQKVMIDKDLADIYQVPTKYLNQIVRRNIERFPADFMFQMSQEEAESLRWQFATSNKRRGGRRYFPLVFTEHGVAMLSSVLKSKKAVTMNISIIRAFIKLREMLATNKDLAQRMDELERSQKDQGNRLESVYSIVKQLIETPIKSVEKMGFNVGKQ
jgi:phage regulator Rha-like protein